MSGPAGRYTRWPAWSPTATVGSPADGWPTRTTPPVSGCLWRLPSRPGHPGGTPSGL